MILSPTCNRPPGRQLRASFLFPDPETPDVELEGCCRRPRDPFHDELVRRDDPLAGVADFAVPRPAPDSWDAVQRQPPIGELDEDEETETFGGHGGDLSVMTHDKPGSPGSGRSTSVNPKGQVQAGVRIGPALRPFRCSKVLSIGEPSFWLSRSARGTPTMPAERCSGRACGTSRRPWSQHGLWNGASLIVTPENASTGRPHSAHALALSAIRRPSLPSTLVHGAGPES